MTSWTTKVLALLVFLVVDVYCGDYSFDDDAPYSCFSVAADACEKKKKKNYDVELKQQLSLAACFVGRIVPTKKKGPLEKCRRPCLRDGQSHVLSDGVFLLS